MRRCCAGQGSVGGQLLEWLNDPERGSLATWLRSWLWTVTVTRTSGNSTWTTGNFANDNRKAPDSVELDDRFNYAGFDVGARVLQVS